MCKFKYWLTYHTKLKLKSNWGAAHGSLLHDVLEFLANGNDTDWMGRLFRGYAGTLETLGRYGDPEVMESPLVWAKPKEYHQVKAYCDNCPFADAENNLCSISEESLDSLTGCPRKLFEGSVSMLERVIAHYNEEIWPKLIRDPDGAIIGTEYKYKLNVAGTDVPMIGIMDLVIEEDPETIHVIDYKSGVKTQDYDECVNDIQVKMYSLACRREFIDDVNGKGYNYKNVMLTFDYFRNTPITLAFSAEEDDATEDFVRQKINEIQGTDWIHRKKWINSNDDLTSRNSRGGFKNWECQYLCDAGVCAEQWKKPFRTDA